MQRHRRLLAALGLAIGLFVAACASPSSPTPAGGASISVATAVATASPAATAPTVATPTAAAQAASSSPTAATTPISGGTASAPATVAGAVRYEVASGTTANYRVREQLARLNAPSDAVGKTSAVTGSIVLSPDGKIVSDQSKITIDITSLQSDSGMRDQFIRGSTLQTSTYPTAVFVPTAIQGLSTPLPTSGQQTFQLVGNLTVHGVTKPVTWNVTSQVEGNEVTGQATTSVKFEDFGMTQPKVASVLSVNDDITLEVTFHLTKSA